MNIPDELRKWLNNRAFLGNGYAELTAIADRIDERHKHAIGYVDDRDSDTMTENGWIRLPQDADGEYIHIGDEVKDVDYDGHASVFDMHIATDGWWVCAGGVCRRPDSYRHYHGPTVEDVLLEFALAVCKDDALTIRKGIVEEYAAKLQLKED